MLELGQVQRNTNMQKQEKLRALEQPNIQLVMQAVTANRQPNGRVSTLTLHSGNALRR